MSVDVKVNINLGALDKACETAQEALCEAVLADCTPNVPKDTGALRRSGRVSGKDEITWSEDYADCVFSGTSRMEARNWFEQTKQQKLSSWVKTVEGVLNA